MTLFSYFDCYKHFERTLFINFEPLDRFEHLANFDGLGTRLKSCVIDHVMVKKNNKCTQLVRWPDTN